MTTFAIFIVIPVFWALVISFQNYDFIWDGTWAGLSNYVKAFTTESGVFVQAIGNTLYYTAITVSANLLVALILASLIQGRNKYVRSFFLAAYYLPAVTSVVIIAITWRWIYNSEFGLLNYLLGVVHIQPVRWLSDPNVVLFNAAMGSIPAEYYQAAHLDGAGPVRRWWSITLPLIRPTILYIVVLYTIASFEVFEKVFLMVPSGVGNSAQVIMTQIYQNGFQQFRYGVASAQAFILFLMIASVAVVQFRALRSDVEY